MGNNEVATQQETNVTVQEPMSMDMVVENVKRVKSIQKDIMQEGLDYGVIPGCPKPSLFQPGAEKLGMAFRLRPSYVMEVVKDDGRVYTVRVICYLKSIGTDAVVGEAISECSSQELKYRTQDVNDKRNTIVAMAQKRAFVRAIRGATAASDVFDADIIDEPGDKVLLESDAAQKVLEQFSKEIQMCKTMAALKKAWAHFTRNEEGECGEFHFLDKEGQGKADEMKNLHKDRLSK